MSDLISRQDAIDRINKQRKHLWPDVYPQDATGDAAYRICAEFIERLPSAERTGHWIQISPAKIYECSVCGQNVMTDDIEAYDYCHGCGARMVSEDVELEK